MFSVAKFLDRAKARGHLDSDYQLAKAIEITQSAISQYRKGKTRPDAVVITKLCTLSGDDPAIVVAEIEADRSTTVEGRILWSNVARRLQATAAVVTMTAAGAMVLVAEDAQAMHSPALLTAISPAQVCILCLIASVAWMQRRRIVDSLAPAVIPH